MDSYQSFINILTQKLMLQFLLLKTVHLKNSNFSSKNMFTQEEHRNCHLGQASYSKRHGANSTKKKRKFISLIL